MRATRTTLALCTAAIAAALAVPSQVSAAQPEFRLTLLPLNCVFETVDDGSGELVYVTPAECGRYVPPPITGQPDSPGLPNIPDVPGSPVTGSPLPSSPAGTQTTSTFGFTPAQRRDAVPRDNEGVVYLNGSSDFSADGLRLTVREGQVLRFTVGSDGRLEDHSVTLKHIGEDHVVLTIASTPFDTTLYVGDTRRYDVMANQRDDIEISLRGIADGTADLVFRQLSQATAGRPGQPVQPAQAEADALAGDSSLPYRLAAGAAMTVLAAAAIHRLARKRKPPAA